MLDRPGLDFSFSGLKTAALVALRGRDLGQGVRADVARGFEEAVVGRWAEKCRRARKQTGHQRLVAAGGGGPKRRLRDLPAAGGGGADAATELRRSGGCAWTVAR